MRKAVPVLVALAAGCWPAAGAWGQGADGVAGSEPLTLREAAAWALATHPSVAGAQAREARAEAGRREQGATLLPAVSLEWNATRFQEPMVVAPLHGFDPQRPPRFDRSLVQGSATLGYTLWDGGARGARLRRADLGVEAAVSGADAARAQLVSQVVRRYAAAASSRALVSAHASRVSALEAERARAARLLEEGRVARVVVLRAEAALSGAVAELTSAEMERDVALSELARVTGLPAPLPASRELEPLRVTGGLPEREAAVQAALAAHPEIVRQRTLRSAAETVESEARSQWWPRVQVGGRYVQYGSGAGNAGGEWQAGMQMSWPLFTAGARPAALDRARAEVRVASAELSEAEQQVAEQAERAHAASVAAAARAAALEAAVAQLEEVVRIDRLALETGAGVQTDYLAAEAELLRARASLVEARYGVVVARAELARAMGELTLEWIEANVESGR